MMSVSTMQISLTDSYRVKNSYGGRLQHQDQSQLEFDIPVSIKTVRVSEGDLVDEGAVLVTLDQEEPSIFCFYARRSQQPRALRPKTCRPKLLERSQGAIELNV